VETSPLRVRRQNGGEPILRPAGDGWESGVAFNAAVVAVTKADRQDETAARLLGAAGLDPILHRFPDPLLSPDAHASAPDYLGVEDPRITRIDGRFVMVYCGCGKAGDTWRATLCTAESSDLLNWRKCGPIDLRYIDECAPSTGHVNNKDGVFFPDRIDGWYYLLHRPMIGPLSTWSVGLARSRSLSGPWNDLGPILRARQERGWTDTWIGAGAVPLPLGNGRYLEI
jgi:predicted GH43/DUF377 family glycosyl hydrolase